MLRVNLGCGEQYAHGWVNVDHSGMPHSKDLELDLRGPLPWHGEVDRMYAGHLLEHLFIDEVIVLLMRMREALHPAGELMVVGPDVQLAMGLEVSQTLEVPLEQIRHGAGRWSGDEHRWECTGRALYRLLEATGWVDVTDVGIANVPAEWPVAFRGPRWQCAVSARRGGEPFHDFL